MNDTSTDDGAGRSTNPRIEELRHQIGILRAHFARLVFIPNLSGDGGRKLRHSVYADGELTPGYVLMCGLSAGIAALGLLQSSTAVVIGAMLISPLMAPIVALGFGFASLDGKKIKDAARVVAVGAGIGILTAILLTWLSPIRNATPEIIARTQPTLLDLAVALFSGLAGGYFIVQQRGATAIGVAIATALMPPLAVVGYGLGIARFDFAGGAFLLFLTNLAAIAFTIALIARLSGAARPLYRVEFAWRYVAMGLAAFAMLATPLALTLLRVSQESGARASTREILTDILHVREQNIAQLDVKWPLRGIPVIEAVVIADSFEARAQDVVLNHLTRALGTKPRLNLQQVVAADIQSQTRAIVDAAMERTVNGISTDVPPFAQIRASIGLPIESIWTNRASRTINIAPVAAPGWTLADYHEAEEIAAKNAGGWRVQLEPPVQEHLTIALTPEARDDNVRLASWAIKNWGINDVRMEIFIPDMDDPAAASMRDKLIADFARENIRVSAILRTGEAEMAQIFIFGLSPSERRAQQTASQQGVFTPVP